MRRRPARVLVIGAGEAGVMAAEELERHPEYGAEPVGFLDDDTSKHGTRIGGLPVLGGRDALSRAIEETGAEELLVAIPSAPGPVIRAVLRTAEATGLPTRIVPGLREIILGDVKVEQIRPVRPEDLLGRESTEFDDALPRRVIEGRRVLVTGAGGSIGADLCRRLLVFGAARLVLVGHGENSIFEIEHELASAGQAGRVARGAQIEPVIADVRDRARIERLVQAEHPDMIVHAAAHKHVHYMERFPAEAIRTNVLGTLHLADAARAAGVERFVMLSTDKAVHPTGVMGRTKRLAELLLQEMAQDGGPTRFMAVRFGNVLGSRGSVVPLFLKQIARGGPLTISDPDATRYFMTIREASSLVLAAAALGDGGEVFVLEMGEALAIGDLARDLIALSGAARDVPIVVTGLRPGEKLTERLWEEDEDARPTAHPSIRVLTAPARLGGVRVAVRALAAEVETLSDDALARRLAEILESTRQPAA